jgi:hypothetical protein
MYRRCQINGNMIMGYCGTILTKKIRNTREKLFRSATFFTKNPTNIYLESNTGLHGERWTIKHLRHVVKYESNSLHGTDLSSEM